MQYLLMIYRSETEFGQMDAAARKDMSAEYNAFTQSIIQSGNFKVRDKQSGEVILPRNEIAVTLLKRLEEDAEALKNRNEGFQAIIEGKRTDQ